MSLNVGGKDDGNSAAVATLRGTAGGGDDRAEGEEILPLVDGVRGPMGFLYEADLLAREMSLDDGGLASTLRGERVDEPPNIPREKGGKGGVGASGS